jgi:uncharacterized protein
MKIGGQATLDAKPELIWPLIFDPRTLLELLPGCDDIQRSGPAEYRARLNLRVPGLAGVYSTHVVLLEHEAPHYCRLQGEANGPGGRIRGTAWFSLAVEGAGTHIAYEGDAQISGPLAGMNPRFAEGVAQNLIRQGLARLPELAQQGAIGTEAGRGPAPEMAAKAKRCCGPLGALFACFLAWLRGLRRT